MSAPPLPDPALPIGADATEGGRSLSLQAALYGAVTSNPDLITLRQGQVAGPSAEAVEVARRFPTTLNPTIFLNYRPITLVPNGTFGNGSPGGSGTTGTAARHGKGGFYHFGQDYLNVSIRQPLELGHQTTHRYGVAKAALEQQRWTVVQAELTAMAQTYRFFQTAAYRRERYRVAVQLADFNERIAGTIQRRLELESNQVQAADASLARVEARAARQQVKAAQQDYRAALADLRNQVGISEGAGAIEPLGEFVLPGAIPQFDEESMVQAALATRPDVHAAAAYVAGTASAARLARGDRIPSPIIGPEYQIDEAGVQYVGFVFIAPIPILNDGTPLLIQRQAEHRRACLALQQVRGRVAAQVRASVEKWNGAIELLNESTGLVQALSAEVGNLERLFDQGQTDLGRLLQAQQRTIQLRNSELDATWAATQAQADLLIALGSPALVNALTQQAEADAGVAPPTPASSLPPPATATPR